MSKLASTTALAASVEEVPAFLHGEQVNVLILQVSGTEILSSSYECGLETYSARCGLSDMLCNSPNRDRDFPELYCLTLSCLYNSM
jgi:hypothetical protein